MVAYQASVLASDQAFDQAFDRVVEPFVQEVGPSVREIDRAGDHLGTFYPFGRRGVGTRSSPLSKPNKIIPGK